MSHIVLLGDSIFDNARYVPDRPPVIEQVRRSVPRGWSVTLLAVDGQMIDDVARQLDRMPIDATHLVVSVGGNDALSEISVLAEPTRSVSDALRLLRQVQDRFRRDYCSMLLALSAAGKKTALCTIYDTVPDLGAPELAALALFNEVILREAVRAGLPVIDLRLTCDRPADYSSVSSIEPSMVGGAKIARAIAEVATGHDFEKSKSVVYW